MNDCVENVCHRIAQALTQVENQEDLNQVVFNFINMVSVMRGRLFQEDTRVEYLSLVRAVSSGESTKLVVGSKKSVSEEEVLRVAHREGIIQ